MKKTFIVLAAIAAIGLVSWQFAPLGSAKIRPKSVDEETRLIAIQEGDTLPKLPKKYLDTPLLWEEFKKYNDFTDPNVLHPGEKMQIPLTFQPRAAIVAECTCGGEKHEISLADVHAAIDEVAT